ncbi:DUF4347 domain-containing protein, partial [Azotobacter salinestris]|uniref:DUF4347 domain-containing protein n=1 Tax=Azotobacter salinestris TaxID=69964 RepID=UPI0032E01895
MDWLKRIIGTSPRTANAGSPASAALILALEPRMMFDGAAPATAVESSEVADAATSDTATGQAESPSATQPDAAGREVAFIDSRLAGYQELLAAIRSDVQVVVLDGAGNALEQMAQWAESHEGYSAIHLIGHGSSGSLQLGSLQLQEDTIAEQQTLLARLGAALGEEGDILLYGCDVAAGDQGATFIAALAEATGADVAASLDATGSASRGGDWELEYQSGSVEAALALDTEQLAGADILLALPSNGLKDLTASTTIGNFFSGFTLETSATVAPDPGDNSIGANGIYLATGSSSGSFTVTADGSNLGSVDLTGISFAKYTGGSSPRYEFTVTGYKLDGSQVTTSFVTLAEQVTFTSGDYSAFTGITGFQIDISNPDGLFNVSNVTFDSFTVANVTAPGTAPTLTATGSNPTFTEKGSAVDLFSGVTAQTNDSGQTFTGMTLTVTNVGNGASEILNIGGTDIGLVAGGGSIAGIGSYSVGVSGGTATVTLSGMSRSDAQMGTLIDGMTYRNASNDPTGASRVVTVTSLTDSGSANSSASFAISSTVSITAVNDAPTLSATGATPTFTENGSAVDLFSGVSIGTLESGQGITGMTLTVANLADGASEILTVDGTDVTLTNGFSTTTATNGMNVTVSLVGGTATVTLSKAGGIGTANAQTLVDGISYRNTRESPTTAGNRVVTLTSITDSGGTANGGADTTGLSVAATVAVAATNDAPTLSGGPYALPATGEDTTSGATLISTLLAGLSLGDADTGALSGIALTASTGNGVWEYSTDGATWASVGTVSGNAALLLASTSQLRYVPDGANGETATLIFRAWDQTSGTASTNSTRSTADTTSNGGSTAFSTGTAQASLTVTAVNDAPVLIPASPSLSGITDGDTDNAGQTVASIVGSSIADVDAGAVEGIAITALDSGTGTWQYSLDNGATWSDVGSVSGSSALLLRASDKVRFVPDGISATTASFTYRAWDQSGVTAGQQGAKVDAGSNGGSTAFSSATDTASITVTAVDDPSTVTTSGGTTAFSEGSTVAIDPGLTLSDSDSGTLASATVSIAGNFQSAQDVLAFVNDGSTMGDITGSYNAATGVLTLSSSGATATLAQWQTALRSVTYTNSSDLPDTSTRVIGIVVNDGTSDSNTATKSVSLTSVNDAPVVSVPSSIVVTEDVASALTGISFSDADAGAGSVTASFSVGSGTLAATSGGAVTVGGSGTGTLTLTGSVANLNAFVAAGNLTFTTAANASSDVTLTVGIDDGGNTGSGGAQTDSTTLTLQVSAVNDAPVISAPVSIGVSEDVVTPLTGISFADLDAGSGSVTVSLSVASGRLTAVSGAGVNASGSGTGTLSLTGSVADLNTYIADSRVSFQTGANATGNVMLGIGIDDGGNSGSGGAKTDATTVTLVVTAVNDAPVNSVPAAQAVDQDAALIFSSGNGNQISIGDVDAGSGTIRVTLNATNGLISLGSSSGLSFISGTGSADATMTFAGTLEDINLALNGLVFVPTAGYNGPASLQIITDDQGLSGSGGAQTDTDTIAITVNSLNPEVTRVSAASADGGYKIGDTLQITVTLDQAVTVDTAGGTPTLLLETGSIDRSATYVSGSGTNTLTFSYTVQAGDTSADLDYASTGALALNGATIRNVTNDDAILTLPTPGGIDSIAGQHAILVDGNAPSVTGVAV